jgi:aminocarboxymuconate-semialdehyde decarboxylase
MQRAFWISLGRDEFMFDVHAHFVPTEVLNWLRENAKRVNTTLEKRDPVKDPFLTIGGKWSFELKQAFHEPELYFAAQDEAGVRHTLVSPIPQLFLYDFEDGLTAEAASVYNQALADLTARNKSRLSALATLPLNNPELAAKELQQAMELGLKGAIIGPGHNGIPLSDEHFAVLWEEADARKAIIFVHPVLNEDKRIQRRKMPNMIGVPFETTVCALDLLLGGVLDRYPNVRILLAHGGGFLPYQVGRLEQAYKSWGEVRGTLEMNPEAYLKRFWYDSVLWNKSALAYLQGLVGSDRVLPGSDFPFDLKTWPPQVADEAGVRVFLGM